METATMLEEVLDTFSDLQPVVTKQGDDDEGTFVIRMIWNSVEMQRLLLTIQHGFPAVSVSQAREEGTPCQENT